VLCAAVGASMATDLRLTTKPNRPEEKHKRIDCSKSDSILDPRNRISGRTYPIPWDFLGSGLL
jgi:hypothetical protein